MTKRILPIMISMIILVSTSSLTLAASSPQDIINQSKTQFQQLSDKLVQINSQLSDLDIQSAKLNNVIKQNNIDISNSENEIKKSDDQLQKLNEEVQSSQALADERLRAMYITGYEEDFLSIIFSSDNYADFISKLDVVSKIISYDKKLLADLDDKKSALNKVHTDLKTKNEKLLALKASNTAALKQINDNKAALQDLTKQFEAEKLSAASVIKDNEEKLIAHSVSVIDSQTPNINDLKSAIDTLKSLSPQISTASVKEKADTYIDTGNKKLTILIANSKNTSSNNNIVSKATYTMSSTAYTGGSITALGLKVSRNPDGLSTVAVDPSVIPLGTKIYIQGYGYAICADTGSAIKGNIIDLYFNSEDECISWGRKDIIVNIIAYPGEW